MSTPRPDRPEEQPVPPAPGRRPSPGGGAPTRPVALLAGGVAIVLAALGGLVYGIAHRGDGGGAIGLGDQSSLTSPSGSPSAGAHPTPRVSSSNRAAATPSSGPSRRSVPGCAAKPSGCGYPDATNTGVASGVSLTVVNGNVTISTNGAVISGKDIHGCVSVQARNVTIKQSKVHCPNDIAVQSFAASNSSLLIEDSEIDCGDTAGTAVGDTSVTAVRVNIHGCENGFDVDNNITVEDSYIHDLNQRPDNHSDGLQLNPGSGVTVRHNTIFVPGGTSAMISSASGDSNVLVQDNILAGGAYTLYCPRDSTSNFVVVDNRFSPIFYPHVGAFGAWTYCANATERHGNVWDNTLKPLTDND